MGGTVAYSERMATQHILVLECYVHLGGGGGGTLWRILLRHCGKSWKVAGSIPGGVIELFHWFNLLAPELFFLILAHSVYKK